MGYISPTFIKITVDQAISQTRPSFLTVHSLLPHFVLSFFAAFYIVYFEIIILLYRTGRKFRGVLISRVSWVADDKKITREIF